MSIIISAGFSLRNIDYSFQLHINDTNKDNNNDTFRDNLL